MDGAGGGAMIRYQLALLGHSQRWLPPSFGLPRLIGGVVLSVLVCCVVLVGVSLVWSSIRHQGDSSGVLGAGVVAHLAGAFTGVAIGLPCSRLLVPRIGYTVLAALAALVAVLLVRWIPLINPMLRAMPSDAPVTRAVLIGVVTSAVVLTLSAAAVATLFRRRS
jgi:hypothetical protein